MFNLIHFIQDTYIKIKYSKYHYKPTRAGFEAYKRYISKSYIAPYVLPPASSSQILSLLSLPDLPTLYSNYDWTYKYCDTDTFYLFSYWDDFKEHSHNDFFSWTNKVYNAYSYGSYSYSDITYNAVIFNPATLEDYCHLCEFIESKWNEYIASKETVQNERIRKQQIKNLKQLTYHLQTLQDKDKKIFEKVLDEDMAIQERLKDCETMAHHAMMTEAQRLHLIYEH